MPTTGDPTRVQRPTLEALFGDHERRVRTTERNVADPTDWIYVGSGDPAPDFQNGFTNAGSSRVPLRYRFLRPYDPDIDPNVNDPTSIEIMGSVTGGGIGLPIFSLLAPGAFPDGTPNWTPVTRDYDVHLDACNDAGGFVVLTVLQNGDVVYGFV